MKEQITWTVFQAVQGVHVGDVVRKLKVAQTTLRSQGEQYY